MILDQADGQLKPDKDKEAGYLDRFKKVADHQGYTQAHADLARHMDQSETSFGDT